MKHDENWPKHRLFGTIAPYSRTKAVQLYAPDTLSYEMYLLKLRERYPTKHGPREHWFNLLSKLEVGALSKGKMLDKEAFEHLGRESALTDTHLQKWHKQFA